MRSILTNYFCVHDRLCENYTQICAKVAPLPLTKQVLEPLIKNKLLSFKSSQKDHQNILKVFFFNLFFSPKTFV